jgi:hypothetical protein
VYPFVRGNNFRLDCHTETLAKGSERFPLSEPLAALHWGRLPTLLCSGRVPPQRKHQIKVACQSFVPPKHWIIESQRPVPDRSSIRIAVSDLTLDVGLRAMRRDGSRVNIAKLPELLGKG